MSTNRQKESTMRQFHITLKSKKADNYGSKVSLAPDGYTVRSISIAVDAKTVIEAIGKAATIAQDLPNFEVSGVDTSEVGKCE